MTSITERLALYETILSVIETKRNECGDPSLGRAIERFLLDKQVQELEEDILSDPGAIEPWLIRPRAGR